MFLTVIFVVLAFCIGVIFGVRDCKKTFGIPKKATPDDVEIYMSVPGASVKVDDNGTN